MPVDHLVLWLPFQFLLHHRWLRLPFKLDPWVLLGLPIEFHTVNITVAGAVVALFSLKSLNTIDGGLGEHLLHCPVPLNGHIHNSRVEGAIIYGAWPPSLVCVLGS